MQSVVLTGASRGIGAAIARQLQQLNVKVVGVARSEDALKHLASTCPHMEYVVGDIGDKSVVTAAMKKATSNASLAGLILNASTLDPVIKVADLDSNAFHDSLYTNVTANIAWIQAAVPHLRQSKGRIIFTSSGVVHGPSAGFAAYCGGKAAMNMLVAALAKEEPDITCLAIAPGVVDTEMLKEYRNAEHRLDPSRPISKYRALDPNTVAEAFAKCVLNAPPGKSGQFVNWNDEWIKQLDATIGRP